MADTPTQDTSFKRIDLTKLDQATPAELDQIRHIVGISKDAANGLSKEELTMNIKAKLYTSYEQETDKEIQKENEPVAKENARKEKAGQKPEPLTPAFRRQMLDDIQVTTQATAPVGKLEFNSFIDHLAQHDMVTPENAATYKKPADESRRKAAEEAKAAPQKPDKDGKVTSVFVQQNPVGNYAALYDYGIQKHEGDGRDKPLVDPQKLQDMMETSIRSTLDHIKAHPLENNNPQMKELVRVLNQDLGVQMGEGSGAKQKVDDARTQEAIKKAQEAGKAK